MADLRDFDRATRCAYCGKSNDMAAGEGEQAPEDGDFSLCIGCGHVGVFDSTAEGGMRRTTPLEAARLAGDPDYSRFRMAWLAMDQRRRAQGHG